MHDSCKSRTNRWVAAYPSAAHNPYNISLQISIQAQLPCPASMALSVFLMGAGGGGGGGLGGEVHNHIIRCQRLSARLAGVTSNRSKNP